MSVTHFKSIYLILVQFCVIKSTIPAMDNKTHIIPSNGAFWKVQLLKWIFLPILLVLLLSLNNMIKTVLRSAGILWSTKIYPFTVHLLEMTKDLTVNLPPIYSTCRLQASKHCEYICKSLFNVTTSI